MPAYFNNPIRFDGVNPTKKEVLAILRKKGFSKSPDDYHQYEYAKHLFTEVWHHVNRTVIDYLGV